MHKIKKFWAFVGTDDSGDEGVPAFYSPDLDMMMPLVGSDRARIESLRNTAQMISDQTGQTFELREFSNYEVIGAITPKGKDNAN